MLSLCHYQLVYGISGHSDFLWWLSDRSATGFIWSNWNLLSSANVQIANKWVVITSVIMLSLCHYQLVCVISGHSREELMHNPVSSIIFRAEFITCRPLFSWIDWNGKSSCQKGKNRMPNGRRDCVITQKENFSSVKANDHQRIQSGLF
jgi:hypothetical protein